MAHRRTVATRSQAIRRKTAWITWEFVPVAVTANGVVQLSGGMNASALALLPFTVVRTRGVIHWESDQAAATEDFGGVFSMQRVTAVALGAGIGSVPTPLTEAGDDYFVYEPFYSKVWVQTTTVVAGGSTVQRIFDSKSMRKLEIGDEISMVIEGMNLPGGMNFGTTGRFLVKLH